MSLHHDQSLTCIPSCMDFTWRQMEDCIPNPLGSFEWLIMPKGLTNAPAMFQRFMNDIFADMINIIVIIYLDEILIYSDNISEHKTHVWEVIHRLHANGLFFHADKC